MRIKWDENSNNRTWRTQRRSLNVTLQLQQPGLGKPGELEPAGPSVTALGAAEPDSWWRRSGSLGLGHTAHRVSPCVGPIKESVFLSLQNIMHPPLRSSLCPPGPVSRTAAVSGADGPRKAHLFPSLPPALLPPTQLRQPQPPAAHTSNHVSPSAQVSRAHSQRHVSSQLVEGRTQLVSGLCRASSIFLCACVSPPHSHTPLALFKWEFTDGDSREGATATLRAGPQLPSDGNSPSCSSHRHLRMCR